MGPILALVIWLFLPSVEPTDSTVVALTHPAKAVLAGTVWIASWWILEVIPISATALLPMILFPLSGALDLKSTAAAYANPMIFLFMGGFMIAVTIEKWNLHKRIALNIILAVGSDLRYIILGFMLATGFLSAWISNTATAVMMMPIGMAVAGQLISGLDSHILRPNDLGCALMLAIAYGCSIGGMATIIGTPTNVAFTGIVEEIYGIQIGFGQWMAFGAPIAISLLYLSWLYLVRVAYPIPKNTSVAGGRQEIERQLKLLGPMSTPEKQVALVFGLVALAWISRSFLLKPLIPGISDTIIGLIGVIVLFSWRVPVSKDEVEEFKGATEPDAFVHDRANLNQPKYTRLLDWQTAEGIPWGILLLFGGGLSIAAAFQASGLDQWIGLKLSGLGVLPFLLLLFILTAAVNFLTEITSNVATASMLLPILAALSLSLGLHPYGLMIACTVAASCAFMLPVATPPNAVVFGSGYLTIPGMIRVGIWMNILSIVLLTLVVYYWLPLAWGIDLSIYPEELKVSE
ncbi:MAG: SLC13 family permease [Bacteroidota bacterium]